MMKIVHLSTANGPGGAFQAAERLHLALLHHQINSQMLVRDKRGDDPTVLRLPSTVGRFWGQWVQYFEQMPVIIRRDRFPVVHSPGWIGCRVVETVRTLNPDLISLRWICGGFLGLNEIGRLAHLGKPIVWTLSDMWPFAGAEHYVGDSQRYLEGYSRGNCPIEQRGWDINRWTWERKRRIWRGFKNIGVISPSRWLADCARKSVLFRNVPIEVVPTGTNIEIFRPIDRVLARDLLRLSPASKIILFIAASATTDSRKGFDLLTEALEQLPEDVKRNACLVVVGASRTPIKPPLPTICLGYLRDELTLALAYNAADVLVAPYREDNYPNTLLESISCGTPVVGFAAGGVREILESVNEGGLAAPYQTADLALQIGNHLQQGDVQKLELRRRLRSWAEANADVNKQALQWLSAAKKMDHFDRKN